ncbi:MAG TPA: T9SS type A sorting domain-containing protein [Puia sp.]|nr:T9SS type A sorting domain-containing protein [Puia sp.]
MKTSNIYRRLLYGILFLSTFHSQAQKTEDNRARDWITYERLTALARLNSSFLSDADKKTLASLQAGLFPVGPCRKASASPCGAAAPPLITGLKLDGTRISAQYAKLDWETLSEFNSRGFVLERRSPTDLLQFDSIYFTAGQGISLGKTKYSYTDPNSSSVTTYYRVREAGLDGNSIYSNVVSIAGVEPTLAVHVVPNPGTSATTGFYIISTSSPTAGFTIANAVGSVLIRKEKIPLSGNTYVSLGSYHLSTGLYIVSVFNEKEQTSRKFIIY